MQKQSQRAYILIYTLVFGSVIVMTLGGFVNWGVNYLKVANHTLHQEESARISEAGIQYYKWHLAHDPDDFQDGTGEDGPYVHDYKDKDGNTIGTFTLTITPPEAGSNITTIVSEGVSAVDPTANKTVRVQIANETIAKYAVLSDAGLYIPEGTEIHGPIHSNGGIRFDGYAHNIVSSALSTYADPTHSVFWDDDDDDDQEEDDEDDECIGEDDDWGDGINMCHIPQGNPQNAQQQNHGLLQSIGHLGHGDYYGTCSTCMTSCVSACTTVGCRAQCRNTCGTNSCIGDCVDSKSSALGVVGCFIDCLGLFDGNDEGAESCSNDSEDDDGPAEGGLPTDPEYAVHTHKTTRDPLPPTTLPSRPDVFSAGRQFPVPAVDLETITNSLSSLKTSAQEASGFFRTSSGAQGFKVVLKNNDTFDLYRVDTKTSAPSGCSGDGDLWGTWSVNGTTSLGNFAFPANGIMYFEDHVWVEGVINTARLTVVAAALTESQSNQKNIIIGNNLQYTAYTGVDSLALIAQANVLFAMTAPTTLRVDAALIAKNGSVSRLGYRAPEGNNNRCSPYHSRTAVTLWGMIASKDGLSLKKTDGTGFQTQNIYYDGNLILNPPPGIPSLNPEQKIISYEELN